MNRIRLLVMLDTLRELQNLPSTSLAQSEQPPPTINLDQKQPPVIREKRKFPRAPKFLPKGRRR